MGRIRVGKRDFDCNIPYIAKEINPNTIFTYKPNLKCCHAVTCLLKSVYFSPNTLGNSRTLQL